MKTLCPCGSTQDYLVCCGQYIEKNILAPTPEALMRSRYTAYSQANIPYIIKTMHGKPLENFNAITAENWAKSVKWRRLKIISTFPDELTEQEGYVEFKACFLEDGQSKILHERSIFHLIHKAWLYVGSD